MLHFALWGAILAFVGVAAGAFGAHALKPKLAPASLEVFEVAVRYEMFHALALLVIGLLARPQTLWIWAGDLLGLGVVLFSGSLYALALGARRRLGAITPLGGLCMLAAWVLVAVALWHHLT